MSRPARNRALATPLVALMAVAPVCVAADQSPAEAKPPTTAPATQPAEVRRITIDEFDKQRTAKDVIVLDVRTPKEFAGGRVPGAVNIPVGIGPSAAAEFAARVGALDKNRPILVHCAAGGRSAMAAARMRRMGFTNLADYAGGMNEWTKAGKPVEKPAEPAQ